MKTYWNNFIKKLPPALRNRYILTFIAFIAWIGFLSNNSWLKKSELSAEVQELRTHIAEKKVEIDKMKKQRQQLSNIQELERVAREKNLYHKPSEKVYIVVEEK